MTLPSPRIHFDQLAALLSPTLGDEAAAAMVSTAARRLSLVGPSFTVAEAALLLDTVAEKGGLVAIACRLAKVRLRITSASIPPPRPRDPALTADLDRGPKRTDRTPPRTAAQAAGADAPRKRVLTRQDIVAVFATTIGNEKAREIVDRTANRLQFGVAGTLDQALLVLEALALEPGIVGVTARFGKARLILR